MGTREMFLGLLAAGAVGMLAGACGSKNGGSDGSNTGGDSATGAVGTGGATTGGATATGGTTTTGGVTTTSGGVPPTGGTTGGSGGIPTGGITGSGGVSTGGVSATGGSTSGGVSGSSGGSSSGGMVGTGGIPLPGGASGSGGEGLVGTGGEETGGTGGEATGGASPTEVTVQLAQTRQEIQGFGINITWGDPLTPERADRLFDVDTGLGLRIVRVGMGTNGDQLSNNIWGDMKLAADRGVEIFIGTLWSPPAQMKSNNNVNDGGHLLPSYYEEWAETIAAFPARVKQNTGIDLYGMSPQNETDFASCGFQEPCNGSYPTTVFTGAEYAAFLKVVGPKLHALNPPVKVISPEASEWIHVWSNESACCTENSSLPSSDPLDCGFPATNCSGFDGYDYGHALYADPEAWAQFDILGTHQYDTQVAEPWPDDVPEKKPVWQTEMSGVKWWPEQGPSSHIENGVAIAGWVHNALTVGEVSAWLWWWEKADSTNEGLILNGVPAKRFWTFGNFTRFVRPGYTRVDVTGPVPDDVLLAAFAGSGNVVIVAINQSTSSVEVPITIAGATAPSSLTPHLTSKTDDLAPQTPIAVSNGIFTATLPGTSVTTFVGAQ